MRQYRYDRALRTQFSSFKESPSFKVAFQELVFDKAKEESRHLSHQPLPSNIDQEDIEKFSYEEHILSLKDESPVLYNCVLGAMATHYGYGEVRVKCDKVVCL